MARVRREIASFDGAGYGDRAPFLGGLARHFGWGEGDYEERFRAALLPHVELVPGARAALDALRRRLPLGLLTDGSSGMQNAKIDRLGIRDLFDRVQISAEFGVSKPGAPAFTAFADHWGVGPASLCMVGDHFERDVEGARAAGLRAVWVGGRGDVNERGVFSVQSVAGLHLDPRFAPLLPAARSCAEAVRP